MKLAHLLLPLAILPLAGCAGTEIEGPYTIDWYRLSFHDGNAPPDEQVTVDSALKQISRRAYRESAFAHAPLSSAELAAITEAIEEANFMHLDPEIESEGHGDSVDTTTLVIGGQTHRVVGVGSDEHSELVRTLEKLGRAKMPHAKDEPDL